MSGRRFLFVPHRWRWTLEEVTSKKTSRVSSFICLVDGGFGEFEAPKVGGRGEEFDADALAAIVGFTKIDDAAFLLFLRFRVGQHNHFAVIDFVLELEKAAVGVDDDGLANFLELASVVGAACRLHAHPVEDASAAARRLTEDFRHRCMFGCGPRRVNL